MFESCMNKGVRFSFSNGLMLSVQWGVQNYCARGHDGEVGREIHQPIWASETAEVAVFNYEGKFVTREFLDVAENEVAGHLTANEVADLMQRVAKAEYGIRECTHGDCRFRDNEEGPVTVCCGQCPKEYRV